MHPPGPASEGGEVLLRGADLSNGIARRGLHAPPADPLAAATIGTICAAPAADNTAHLLGGFLLALKATPPSRQPLPAGLVVATCPLLASARRLRGRGVV